MSTPIQFRLTAAGQQAAWNAQNTGLSLELTHVQFGSGNRTPDGNETALLSPKKAVPIAAGSRVSPSQIRLSTMLTGPESFTVSEIGIWKGEPGQSGSVLFAYWSQGSGNIAAKAPGVDFIFSHDMALGDAVAAGSVTILADTSQSALLALLERHKQDQNGHPLVTQTANGFMSTSDKKALDALKGHGHPDATQSAPGFMSAADKRILDWLAGTIAPEVAAPSMVAFFARRSAPAGWLPANGAAISRTAYANLFTAIGTHFGPGDGSTTFNLPDLRGLFLRGFDDGRGIDVGRAFGSKQEDAIRNIIGSVSGAGYLGLFDAGSGAFRTTQGAKHINAAQGGDAYYNDFNFDASRVVPTANETRPKNVAFLLCIKY